MTTVFYCYQLPVMGHTYQPDTKIGDRQYIINNTSPKTNNAGIIISLISAVASILSILVVWYNVRSQLRSVEKNIMKQFSLQESNTIRETISNLIAELSKPDSRKIERKDHMSEKHLELEKKLIMLLDDKNPDDKKLIDCITRFQTEVISDKNSWITKIKEYAFVVILNKIK